MPIQSDSLLNTVKQGTQLTKQSSEAVSSLAAKTGLPKPPSTPLETAVIGGTPSQAKMAATPAALQGQAAQQKLAPTLQLATQERRAQVSTALTAEQERARQVAQHMASLGSSLGSRVPALIQSAIDTTLSGQKVTAQVDPTKLPPELSATDKAALSAALTTLSDPAKQKDHAAALVTVSNLTKQDLSKLDPTTLSTAISGYFKDTKSNVAAAVEAATPATVTLGLLENPGSLGYSSWDSLAEDLGLKPEVQKDGTTKSAADLVKGLTVKQLGEMVDTLKRASYQTQQGWMQILNDPTTSPQDRQVARTMLMNMGASGVRETEARMANLTSQVQAANQVTVNFSGVPTKMDIESVMKSDLLKGAVSILLNPQDPSFKAVSEANPDLLKWVNSNRDALSTQLKGVSDDVKAFATQNAANAKILDAIIPDAATKEKVGKVLFDTWGKVTDQKYDLKNSKLLNSWATYSPAQQSAIQDAVSTVAAGGTAEDVAAFIATSGDNLARLNLFSPAGMQAFKSYWGEQQFVRSLGTTTNLENPNIAALNLTGMTQEQLTNATKVAGVLAKYGFKSTAKLPASVQDALKMAGSPKAMSVILEGSSIPSTVKDAIKKFQQDQDAFTNGPDAVVNAIGKAVLKKGGDLDKNDVKALAGQFSSSADLKRLQDMTGIKLTSPIVVANRAEIEPVLAAQGIPNLMQIEDFVRDNQDQAGRVLDALSSISSKVQPELRSEFDKAVKAAQLYKKAYDKKQGRPAEEPKKGGPQFPDTRLSPGPIFGGALEKGMERGLEAIGRAFRAGR